MCPKTITVVHFLYMLVQMRNAFNTPHRLGHLNIWVPVDRAVWEGWGGEVVLKEIHHWKQLWEFKSLSHLYTQLVSALYVKDMSSQPPTLTTILVAFPVWWALLPLEWWSCVVDLIIVFHYINRRAMDILASVRDRGGTWSSYSYNYVFVWNSYSAAAQQYWSWQSYIQGELQY